MVPPLFDTHSTHQLSNQPQMLATQQMFQDQNDFHHMQSPAFATQPNEPSFRTEVNPLHIKQADSMSVSSMQQFNDYGMSSNQQSGVMHKHNNTFSPMPRSFKTNALDIISRTPQ